MLLPGSLSCDSGRHSCNRKGHVGIQVVLRIGNYQILLKPSVSYVGRCVQGFRISSDGNVENLKTSRIANTSDQIARNRRSGNIRIAMLPASVCVHLDQSNCHLLDAPSP